MTRAKTKGICTYCKKEIPKNSKSIVKHIEECEAIVELTQKKNTQFMIILIEGKYDPDYWLVIKAKSDLSLKKIDKFIRDIWVECCGHMSEFSISSMEIGKTKKLYDAFEEVNKINYVYDFGSSTDISLSLIDVMYDADDNEIKIIIRNKEIDHKCSYCNNKAVAVCPICVLDEEGWLCESCIEKHKCVIEEGRDFILPIVNSPRLAECGYIGYDVKVVKKYFPKEII